MDKYWETKRELETLRQRLSTERDDELETLQTSKRSLEKKVSVCVCACACAREREKLKLLLFAEAIPSISEMPSSQLFMKSNYC